MAVTLLSAHDLERRIGARKVLDGVSLTIERGDRVGLIGRNGAGKSTLIRCLIGAETPDDGSILRKKDLSVAVVEQVPSLGSGLQTVGEAILQGLETQKSLEGRLEALETEMGQIEDPEHLNRLVELQAELGEALERLGGRNYQHQADAMLDALSAPPSDRYLDTLSLGERRRVALAVGLLQKPELLILDEPTNHLDVETIEWLENHLQSYDGGVLLVTHDRHFLDRVTLKIAELDRGELRVYLGNYGEYLLRKAEREAIEAKSEANRHRAIRSEIEWVRRSPAARTTKSKSRLQRFDEMVAAVPKRQLGDATFRLPHPPRIGKTILELKGLSKCFGTKVLVQDLNLIMSRGTRIGIVGPNGAGKTTLLRMILGELEPDEGTIEVGQNTKIVYADQGRTDLEDEHSVLEEVAGQGDKVFVGDQPVQVQSFLEGLLFDGAQQRAKIGTLSGGERTRVALAKRLREAGNLLILDEPTNDLDLATLRVLEDALLSYPGCVLVVSHDRWFLDRVTTSILAFQGAGEVVFYEGGHADWRLHQRTEREAARPSPAPAAPPGEASGKPPSPGSTKPKPKRRSFKEQKEFEGMEATILAAEEEVEVMEARLADPETLRALGAEVGIEVAKLETTKKGIEVLYARWAELSELLPYG